MKRLELTTNLGQMLRFYRACMGLDLREAAAYIGVSYPTLMRIEKGRAMDAATWLKIQGFLFRKTAGLTKNLICRKRNTNTFGGRGSLPPVLSCASATAGAV